MERPRPITVKRARELLDQHGIATCCDGPYRARVVTVRDDGHGMRIWLQYPDASKATGVAYESHPIHRVYDADEWDRWMASRSMGEQAAYAKARSEAGEDDRILAFGSFLTVSDVLGTLS